VGNAREWALTSEARRVLSSTLKKLHRSISSNCMRPFRGCVAFSLTPLALDPVSCCGSSRIIFAIHSSSSPRILSRPLCRVAGLNCLPKATFHLTSPSPRQLRYSTFTQAAPVRLQQRSSDCTSYSHTFPSTPTTHLLASTSPPSTPLLKKPTSSLFIRPTVHDPSPYVTETLRVLPNDAQAYGLSVRLFALAVSR
jgi:hypothetical protein